MHGNDIKKSICLLGIAALLTLIDTHLDKKTIDQINNLLLNSRDSLQSPKEDSGSYSMEDRSLLDSGEDGDDTNYPEKESSARRKNMVTNEHSIGHLHEEDIMQKDGDQPLQPEMFCDSRNNQSCV
jgi:hypothetical protein